MTERHTKWPKNAHVSVLCPPNNNTPVSTTGLAASHIYESLYSDTNFLIMKTPVFMFAPFEGLQTTKVSHANLTAFNAMTVHDYDLST